MLTLNVRLDVDHGFEILVRIAYRPFFVSLDQ
jgi:hypothetical protein